MYLCLLWHIIMMHFGNGDKPNASETTKFLAVQRLMVM